MNPLIEIKNLSKTFVSNGKKLPVLSDISLTVSKGDFLAILGASGSGKSTFLRCVGGFERPTSGSISVNGRRVEKPGPHAAMVFQSFDQLFPWKTVYENIAYPLKINAPKNEKKETEETVNRYLNMVGLAGFRDYYPHQLSGGMKQRAAIARALAQKPSVILMDEPFASLDADTRTTLGREIVDIWHKAGAKITILFVTHSIIEAISVATKFMVLKGNDYIVFHNPVKGKAGSVRSPENGGFDECWKKLKSIIRN